MATWPDPYLIGNGTWCSCCFPDGPPRGFWNRRGHRKQRRGCNECAGAGRIALSAETIIQNTIAEARSWWEAQERRKRGCAGNG